MRTSLKSIVAVALSITLLFTLAIPVFAQKVVVNANTGEVVTSADNATTNIDTGTVTTSDGKTFDMTGSDGVRAYDSETPVPSDIDTRKYYYRDGQYVPADPNPTPAPTQAPTQTPTPAVSQNPTTTPAANQGGGSSGSSSTPVPTPVHTTKYAIVNGYTAVVMAIVDSYRFSPDMNTLYGVTNGNTTSFDRVSTAAQACPVSSSSIPSAFSPYMYKYVDGNFVSVNATPTPAPVVTPAPTEIPVPTEVPTEIPGTTNTLDTTVVSPDGAVTDDMTIDPPVVIDQPVILETPTNLIAVADKHSVVLTWNPVANKQHLIGYYIYRRTSDGGYSDPITDFQLNSVSYTDNKIVPGKDYFYICKAIYVAGSSQASNEVTAKSTATKSIDLQINNKKVKVNGLEKDIDPENGTAPIIVDGRTILPIRVIIEELGGTVDWNAKTRTATILLDGTTIEITINNNKAKVNGINKDLDVPAQIINGKTFIPLRFIVQNLGCDVTWDGTTGSVNIVR
jgi:hypothetical protein